jgi:hypothetical protein
MQYSFIENSFRIEGNQLHILPASGGQESPVDLTTDVTLEIIDQAGEKFLKIEHEEYTFPLRNDFSLNVYQLKIEVISGIGPSVFSVGEANLEVPVSAIEVIKIIFAEEGEKIAIHMNVTADVPIFTIFSNKEMWDIRS